MRQLLLLLALVVSPAARAFDADSSWPSGTRSFTVLLDGGATKLALPGSGLLDGSASWDVVAQDMATVWNIYLTRIQLSLTSSTGSPASGNLRNEIAFSSTAYGEDFGERTLAVTFTRWQSGINRVRLSETDILVNTAITWDSYRGRLRAAIDLRRVLIHEMGHALGLQHPDQAHPPQSVTAIMNSTVSNLETVASDDIAGARLLYGTAIRVPTITRQPQGGTYNEGDAAAIFVETDGGTPPPPSPILSYSWTFTPPGGRSEWLFGQPDWKIPLGTVQTSDAGTYRLRIETPDGDTQSNSVTLNVNPVAKSANTRLYNLSTRGLVGSGDQALVVGFVIQSSSTRRVLIRGVGPGLIPLGVGNAISDPVIDVRRVTGDVQVGFSDAWQAESGAGLADTFARAGAFALPANSEDAALVLDLPSGNYTATLTPKAGVSSGLGLVEVYDITSTSSTTERLYNLSARGYVGRGTEMLVGGLAVRGDGPGYYLVRGVGDTLKSFNVSSTLDDPVMRVYDEGGTVLRYADDWDNPEFFQDTLSATMSRVGAFALTDRQETAQLLKLKPGNFTIHLAGFKGGTGVALLEIYEVD